MTDTPSTRAARSADDIDRGVSARVFQMRKAAGLTQGDLAQAIGVTFQQVQKYESGANRISAGRLWAIAQALGQPVGTFFPDPGNAE